MKIWIEFLRYFTNIDLLILVTSALDQAVVKTQRVAETAALAIADIIGADEIVRTIVLIVGSGANAVIAVVVLGTRHTLVALGPGFRRPLLLILRRVALEARPLWNAIIGNKALVCRLGCAAIIDGRR